MRAGAAAELHEHLERCGVAADAIAGLPALELRRAEWEKADAAVKAARLKRELTVPLVPADLVGSDVDLASRRATLEASDKEREELHRKIAEITTRIDEVTKGRSIEEAISLEDAARAALIEHRDAQQARCAKHALVGWLREQSTGADAPALLARAREWFLRFTRNRYQLQLGDDSRFRAFDMEARQYRSLGQLSDGTRIQLLLAARLSYIEHVEQDGPAVPIFLDEVLSTTDPSRFAAVAHAVMELAKSGRQVFYATADPDEAAAWEACAEADGFEAPQVVRLGEAQVDPAWERPPRLPAPAPSVPDPSDMDAAGWTKALGMSRPTLHTDIGGWPLGLLLPDRLDAAAAAAKEGFRTAGQLDLGITLPLDDSLLALVRARRTALEGALGALRVGRGKPVPWSVVVESGAVTKTFLAAVQGVHEELSSDPEAFLAAVCGLKGFRSSNKRKLGDHLQDQGILDPATELAAGDVVENAQRACREAIEQGLLSLADVEAWVRVAAEVVRVDFPRS